MTTPIPNASQLSRAGHQNAVPLPTTRWASRIVLPASIALITLGLLGYSARALLWPAIDVWVVPVVAAAESHMAGAPGVPAGSGDLGQIQAPGWIEPSPYPLIVPALTEGVVKELLVLEGQHVEEGQVIARLIDDDARLRLERSEAELREHRTAIDRARAHAQATEARESEIRFELERKEPLVESGAVSAGLVASLHARLDATRLDTAAARSDVSVVEAGVQRLEVNVREATLNLGRTQIRAPKAGVVLSLMVEPGQRLSMGGKDGGAMNGGIVRLYDPSKLQVRVDVPLADAAKVGAGSLAEITTEALPGRVFHGRALRVMHEANIQRNTVQVKVSIDDPPAPPAPMLRPEMLARVRLSPPPSEGSSQAAKPSGHDSSGRLLLPASTLTESRDGHASVWLADQSHGAIPRAIRRDITIGGNASDGNVFVTSGLAVGDRVIVDAPAGLTSGARVRVLGERPEKKAN